MTKRQHIAIALVNWAGRLVPFFVGWWLIWAGWSVLRTLIVVVFVGIVCAIVAPIVTVTIRGGRGVWNESARRYREGKR